MQSQGGVGAAPTVFADDLVLSATTQGEPKAMPMGGYTWIIKNWTLNNSTATGGYVIQKYTESIDIKDAAGEPYTPPSLTKVKDSSLTYWEAFKVNACSKESGKDYWNGPPLTGPGGAGLNVVKLDITGSASYYDGMTDQKLENLGFIKDNPNTFAGELFSTTKLKGNLPAASTNTMTRELHLSGNATFKSMNKKTSMVLKAKDYGFDNKTFMSRN